MKNPNLNNRSNAKVFVFEGVDHVGKTTIISQLNQKLTNEYNLSVLSFSFPGKEERTLGGLVYDIHHNTLKYFNEPINSASIQLLHIASHIDNIYTKIIPAMKNSEIILLDRFWWSTFAYGIANGIPKTLLEKIIAPELYCLQNVHIEKYFLIKRNDKEIDFDLKTYNCICKIYDELCDENENAFMIHNNGKINETINSILKYII